MQKDTLAFPEFYLMSSHNDCSTIESWQESGNSCTTIATAADGDQYIPTTSACDSTVTYIGAVIAGETYWSPSFRYEVYTCGSYVTMSNIV